MTIGTRSPEDASRIVPGILIEPRAVQTAENLGLQLDVTNKPLSKDYVITTSLREDLWPKKANVAIMGKNINLEDWKVNAIGFGIPGLASAGYGQARSGEEAKRTAELYQTEKNYFNVSDEEIDRLQNYSSRMDPTLTAARQDIQSLNPRRIFSDQNMVIMYKQSVIQCMPCNPSIYKKLCRSSR